MSARFLRAILRSAPVWALMLFVGCGHEVAPTPDFSDPASIPLCCASDFGAGCCDLDVSSFSEGVDLNWFSEDEIFSFIDGWIVYRAVGQAVPDNAAFTRLNEELFTERIFVDRDVVDGERYWYRLTSISPAGVESEPTQVVTVLVDHTAPAPPTGLMATAGITGIFLDWDVSPEPDVDHYNLFREPPMPASVFGPIPTNVPAFLDVLAKSGMTYRYWVTAVDEGLNESTPSDTVEVTAF